MVRPASLSSEEIATHVLKPLKPAGARKVSEITKFALPATGSWRFDYELPDADGQTFNSAIAVPLSDRRVLLIQVNGASQLELDSLLASLKKLQVPKKAD
jgi:hypothetical protein